MVLYYGNFCLYVLIFEMVWVIVGSKEGVNCGEMY